MRTERRRKMSVDTFARGSMGLFSLLGTEETDSEWKDLPRRVKEYYFSSKSCQWYRFVCDDPVSTPDHSRLIGAYIPLNTFIHL